MYIHGGFSVNLRVGLLEFDGVFSKGVGVIHDHVQSPGFRKYQDDPVALRCFFLCFFNKAT